MSKEFTVMLLSEKNGRHYTIKFNISTLIIIVVVFVCIVFLAVWSFTNYSNVRQQNSINESQIKKLETEINILEEDNREAVYYKQWAERIVFNKTNYEDIPEKGNNTFFDNVLHGETEKKIIKRPSQILLDVDGFDIRRLLPGRDFEVSFKLINRQKGNNKVAGYIFIIASNVEAVPEIYSSWPPVELSSGKPADFTKGDSFSIRYLKETRGEIKQTEVQPEFNRVDLIAYSEDGKIIMTRGFNIIRLLKQGSDK